MGVIMPRIVEFVPYDLNWTTQFTEEATKIKTALGENCIIIHHIGSTSVPGLAAKPVLDIMPVVQDITQVNVAGLEAIGYVNRGELGMPFRIYMHKGAPQHSHHLHIWEQGNPEIEKHLMFRDYLINHMDARQRYATIKEQLASQYRNEHRTYTTLKDQFIKDLLYKTGFNGLTIVQPLHSKEREEYHRIRKKEIFDPLPNIVYDPEHPTMTDPNHFHFILMLGIRTIGIAQVEMLDAKTSVLRMLAIDQPYQSQGYGDYLLKQMERWVASQGKMKILMHAATRAEKFYRNRGYSDMKFNDVGIHADHVDLGKNL